MSVYLTLAVLWTSALSGRPALASESSALESLACRNDYRTHIRCSWRNDPRIPLSLIHMDPDDQREAPCVQTPRFSSKKQERVHCRYNTSLFAIGFDDVFFFHTPHSSAISRIFRIRKIENTDPDWNFNQLEDTPPPSLLTSDLMRWPDLERSVSARMTRQRSKEEPYHEKGGKIHIKPTQKFEGGYNETKTSDLSYEQPELISEYSLPGPSNLHCVLNGGKNVSCSWDLDTNLAQYISYSLTYRTHSTVLPEWCSVEKLEVRNQGDVLRMVGVFNVFEPEVLEVRLKSTPVTKVIRSYEHIQPSGPTGLRVELRGENWILNWTLTKYRTVPLTTELKYWSTITPEDVISIFLSDGEMVFAISERSLKGSSEYQAQVRCNVSAPRRSGWRYSGYPSEWTDPIYWTTRPEPLAPHLVAFLLYFLIATLASAVSIAVFILFIFVQRRLREWDTSLPSPALSQASEVSQHLQRDHFPCCTELRDPDISNAQIVDVCPQSSSLVSEMTLTDQDNIHFKETKGDRAISLVDNQCLVSSDVMEIDDTSHPHTSNLHDQGLPQLEGYMPNPAASVGSAHVSQEACSLNIEMGDGYMNCPKPDLTSLKQRTYPNFIHNLI